MTRRARGLPARRSSATPAARPHAGSHRDGSAPASMAVGQGAPSSSSSSSSPSSSPSVQSYCSRASSWASLPSQRNVMRQGPLTAMACRPSRLPFNGCTLQPGMFRSESAVAAWSASMALLQRLCRSGCTFRLLPASKSSRNPACRKLTSTASIVKQTRQSVNCRFTLRPAPYSSRHAGGANRTVE